MDSSLSHMLQGLAMILGILVVVSQFCWIGKRHREPGLVRKFAAGQHLVYIIILGVDKGKYNTMACIWKINPHKNAQSNNEVWYFSEIYKLRFYCLEFSFLHNYLYIFIFSLSHQLALNFGEPGITDYVSEVSIDSTAVGNNQLLTSVLAKFDVN